MSARSPSFLPREVPTQQTQFWTACLGEVEQRLPPAEANSWLRTVQARAQDNHVVLYAPNRYVADWINEHCLQLIKDSCRKRLGDLVQLEIKLGSCADAQPETQPVAANGAPAGNGRLADGAAPRIVAPQSPPDNQLNTDMTFERFIEGKSNKMARAAAMKVAESPGQAYKLLFLYGGVGLGKTHLMHAIGNAVLERNPATRIAYRHSEQFVAEMVGAIRHGRMDEFKRSYRSLDMLLIDDVQMFVDKKQTQEEFFHTFNSLYELRRQIVLTCDQYPRDIEGLEDRLRSRFGGGLTQVIDPPELETRAAILASKAGIADIELPDDVALFIAQRVRANVRELEGSLHQVLAHADLMGKAITVDLAKEALRDQISSHARQISMANIQKTVSNYYNIPVKDILSPKRNRPIVLARHVAMTLAKDLTNHSLPEIGSAFGDRDHTTVLHSYRKIRKLCDESKQFNEEYSNLKNMLDC